MREIAKNSICVLKFCQVSYLQNNCIGKLKQKQHIQYFHYSFLKVENVEIFIKFPHYGNFLFHKLNSCRGNYWRGETIQGRKLFAEIRYIALKILIKKRAKIDAVVFLRILIFQKIFFDLWALRALGSEYLRSCYLYIRH